MTFALTIISCLAAGYLIVALGWPRPAKRFSELLLRASLSVGYGLGLFSLLFFLARVLGISHLVAIDVVVLAMLCAAFLLIRTRILAAQSPVRSDENVRLPRWLDRCLTVSFTCAICGGLYSAILRSIAHPHGEGWDAFAIWNLHARFLFRGGEHWRDGLSPLIPWSHPDYPLLLPAAVAHFWSILGHEDTAVPALISLCFTLGTVGLLSSSLTILRGRTFGMLGGLALLSTPFFIEQGSSQYADVPLAYFFLAAMVLLHLHRRRLTESSDSLGQLLVLCGMAAGCAVWTKNEGLLFLSAMLVARVLVRIGWTFVLSTGMVTQRNRAETWADLLKFAVGVAPFFLLVVWFRHSIAFSSELFSNQGTMLQRILDPSRYGAIVKWFAKEFLRFGEWWLIPGTVLLIVLYFLGDTDGVDRRSGVDIRSSVWTLTLTLAGYFAIYMITPYDLYWHLRFSLNRLFLQLWPCAIFLFFLASPLKMGQQSQNEP